MSLLMESWVVCLFGDENDKNLHLKRHCLQTVIAYHYSSDVVIDGIMSRVLVWWRKQ